MVLLFKRILSVAIDPPNREALCSLQNLIYLDIDIWMAGVAFRF